MRTVCALFVLLACAQGTAAAQEFEVGTPAFVQWGKWSEDELTARRLVRVELEVDGALLDGLPPLRPIPDAPLYEHQIPQSLLTIGPHLVRGRPCSAVKCGDWIEVAMTYTPLEPGFLKQFQIHMGATPSAFEVK